MNNFKCKVCGAPVQIEGDKITRSCDHKDAGVLADMSAHARGLASFNREEQQRARETEPVNQD